MPFLKQEPKLSKIFSSSKSDSTNDTKGQSRPRIFSAIGRLDLNMLKVSNHYFRFMDDWTNTLNNNWIKRTKAVSCWLSVIMDINKIYRYKSKIARMETFTIITFSLLLQMACKIKEFHTHICKRIDELEKKQVKIILKYNTHGHAPIFAPTANFIIPR